MELQVNTNSKGRSYADQLQFGNAARATKYVKLLQQCGDSKSLSTGKQVHKEITDAGLHTNTQVGNLLIRMYTKCGYLEEAQAAFQKIRHPDLVSWNSMLAALAKASELQAAKYLFDSMPEKSTVSWNVLIAAYAQNGHMTLAEELFEKSPVKDAASWNTLLTGYAQNGMLSKAEEVFKRIPEPNVVSWNALIAAYAQTGHFHKAFKAFRSMVVQPNEVTFVTFLEACVRLGGAQGISQGRHVYARAVSMGLTKETKVANAFMSMFAKCGSLADCEAVFDMTEHRNVRTYNIMMVAYGLNGKPHEARVVFNGMKERSLVSWNVLITAYAQVGHVQQDENSQAHIAHAERAFEVFKFMGEAGVKPDEVTFLALLDACVTLGNLQKGREMHRRITGSGLEKNVQVSNALINMYGKLRSIHEAKAVFRGIHKKTVVTWTTMMDALGCNGLPQEAFYILQMMVLEGYTPCPATFSMICDSCVCLRKGRLLEETVVELGFDSDQFVGSALVSMHGKSGSIDSAWTAFSRIHRKNLVSWTAIVSAFAGNGLSKTALGLFWEMELEGWSPDEVSLTCILSACQHAGELNMGVHLFQSMTGDYGLVAKMGHFLCVVDLLARSSKLESAEELINSMPYEPPAQSWSSLLGACKVQADSQRAKRAARGTLTTDPGHTASYILFSTMKV